MTMDEGEIVRNYRAAKFKSKQVGILAELNACSVGYIEEILRKNLKPQELPRKRTKSADVAIMKKDTDIAKDNTKILKEKISNLEELNQNLKSENERTYKQMMENEKDYQQTIRSMTDDIDCLKKELNRCQKAAESFVEENENPNKELHNLKIVVDFLLERIAIDRMKEVET